MSLRTIAQIAWPAAALPLIAALVLVLLPEARFVLGFIVVLPFIIGMWVARNWQVYLTKQCSDRYIQKRVLLNR